MTSEEKPSRNIDHFHCFMSSGTNIFQDKKYENKYDAIELFMKIYRSMFSQQQDQVTTELAIMKMIDHENFIGVYIGEFLRVNLMPCSGCKPVLYN